MKIPFGFVFLLILPLLGGCIAASRDGAVEGRADKCEWTLTQQSIEGSDDIDETATVRFIDLEGGFWGIVTDGGRTLRPADLCDDLKEDGLRVHVEGRTRPDLGGVHMWGESFDLRLVERA